MTERIIVRGLLYGNAKAHRGAQKDTPGANPANSTTRTPWSGRGVAAIFESNGFTELVEVHLVGINTDSEILSHKDKRGQRTDKSDARQ